jgi:hypothetical protein
MKKIITFLQLQLASWLVFSPIASCFLPLGSRPWLASVGSVAALGTVALMTRWGFKTPRPKASRPRPARSAAFKPATVTG